MHIYFLGICGTAMGNAALLLREQGCRVEGSDRQVYPPMSDVLRNHGIEILEGFDAARLASSHPDLVVVGNSIVRGNPEFEWLLSEKRIPFVSLPALLHDRLLATRRNIVVAGTHGKTTTAALAAVLLRANGSDPGYFIGGVPRDLPGGASLGSEDAPFVIEGDEYDSALFDKRSKFIHYAPHIAIINNLEFDHADIFRDLADVQRSFNHLLKIVPGNGFMLLNGDDPHVASLSPTSWGTTFRVGTSEACDLRIRSFREGPEGATFELVWQGRLWAQARWGLSGLYNARNAAMAALAAALSLHPSDVTRLDLSVLETYEGVKRRQEKLFESRELTVLEDFGHHPTAVGNILESLRQRYPGRKLVAVFEPRSNTSRRNVLQAELVRALSRADEVFLGPINRPESLADAERLNLQEVVGQLRAAGVGARTFPSNGELLEGLMEATLSESAQSRVVTFFTNGSFDGIIGKFAAAAQAKVTGPAGKHSR
jgi:UDP-N-acetylmuramate: L-alanyl-gamma-D-glutamyl-meso-diaminopimelate ligase